MWFEPAVKAGDGFGAGFARGQRAGPENLHRAKIRYVGYKREPAQAVCSHELGQTQKDCFTNPSQAG